MNGSFYENDMYVCNSIVQFNNESNVEKIKYMPQSAVIE